LSSSNVDSLQEDSPPDPDEIEQGDAINDALDAKHGDAAIDKAQRFDPDTDITKALRPSPIALRVGLIVGLTAVLVLGATWLGLQLHHTREAEHQRQLFLQVGRQAALNLTTIDFNTVDADVQRVLDSSTGSFHDDFQRRSSAFTEVVRQAQAKSVGSVKEVGIESMTGDAAQVLVAASVQTSNAGAPEQEPRNWRMRVSVQKVGHDVKVSNVGFVP